MSVERILERICVLSGVIDVTKTSSQDRKLQRTDEQMLAVESCADGAMKRSDRSILESDDESQRHFPGTGGRKVCCVRRV